MKDIIKKILREEFDDVDAWIESEPTVPNYNGHPQGVVYVRTHEDIETFFDIIEKYNLQSCGKKGEHLMWGGRTSAHKDLNSLHNPEQTNGLTMFFFVRKPKDDRLCIDHTPFILGDTETIGNYLIDMDAFNKEYGIYDMYDFKKLFDIYLT